jgi:CheY-like chemotaxis protein
VDGEQASDLLQRITAAQENNCPDLILLDLNLPRLDGITVLEIIRQHEQCANIPVAVLTSSSAPSDRERVLSLGIETFIQKPVNFDDFLAIGGTLKDILSSRSTRS